MRRAQIEQRCRETSPQIPLHLLPHMEAFAAAMQVHRELSQKDWEALKPRLSYEMPTVEARLRREQSDTQSSGHAEDPRMAEKAAETLAWENTQTAIRYRLDTYAERCISNEWDNGKSVTGLNIPDFACQVLTKCRQDWESDLTRYGVRGPDEEPSATNTRAVPHGDLTLDAMKYVFLSKIKSLADVHGSHLFICPKCELPHHSQRTYPFEACIQHYAAKHTRAFGTGPSGVTWRKALWPKEAPFAPDNSRRNGVRGPRGHGDGRGNPSSNRSGPHPLPAQPPVAAMPQPAPQPPPQPLSANFFINGQTQTFPIHPAHRGTQTPIPYPHSAAPSPAQTPYPQSPYPNYGMYPRPLTGTPGTNMPWIAAPPPRPPAFSPPVPTASAYPPPPYQHGSPYPPPAQQMPRYPGPPYQQGTPYPYPGSPAFSLPSAYPSPSFTQQAQLPGQNLYDTQRDKLAETARDVFDLFTPLFTVHRSVSIYCSVRHSASRFSELFTNELTFDLFFDCVFNHRSMDDMKNTQQLHCKSCPGPETAPSPSFRMYTYHQLLLHFKLVHVDAARNTQMPPADWKEDMIGLPQKPYLRQVLKELDGHDKAREMFLEHFSDMIQDSPQPENQYDPHHPEMSREVSDRGRQEDVMRERVRQRHLRKSHV